jgi:hypothetical protein
MLPSRLPRPRLLKSRSPRTPAICSLRRRCSTVGPTVRRGRSVDRLVHTTGSRRQSLLRSTPATHERCERGAAQRKCVVEVLVQPSTRPVVDLAYAGASAPMIATNCAEVCGSYVVQPAGNTAARMTEHPNDARSGRLLVWYIIMHPQLDQQTADSSGRNSGSTP